MKFILILAVICLVTYIFLSRRKFRQAKTLYIPRFSENVSHIIQEAIDLSTQETAVPVHIFQLAGKLASLENKDEVIAAADYIYNADTAKFGFARRVSLTTLRFIGVYPYSQTTQNIVDYLILRGLNDVAVWVRYDAAWVATMLKIKNAEIISKLREMQTTLTNKEIEANSAESSLQIKINEFFE